MIRRPPRSTQSRSSAASDVYKRQEYKDSYYWEQAGLLAAELSGDLYCKEGGVDAFSEVEGDALIIVDPEIYKENQQQLGNLEIVYQNEYLLLKK